MPLATHGAHGRLGTGFPADAAAEEELRLGLPFVHVELLEQADMDVMLETVFAADRKATPKGMIEVLA